jgi:hypothetical protein
MRYFTLVDFQYVVLAVFIGIVLLLLVYISFGGFYKSRRKEAEAERYPEELQIEKNPIPPILVFIYVAFIFWVISYVVIIGIKGNPF